MKPVRKKPSTGPALPEELLQPMLLGTAPVNLSASRRERLRERLLRRVCEEERAWAESQYLTVRAEAGKWVPLAPLVKFKLLYEQGDTWSYLIRFDPGAVFPAHLHESDEECLVLEGEGYLGDIFLRAGDYHLARAGSRHGEVRTRTGALLFIRSRAMPHCQA